MLETILEIGRILRASPDGLKHHRYIKRAPVPDKKKDPVRFWCVPVQEDGSFDFSKVESLDDENAQKRMYYLNYKTSDADSTKPYLFGDIYRSVTKAGEDGNFRFGDPAKKSWMALNSFQRGEKSDSLSTDRVKAFRQSFRQQMDSIAAFLHDNAAAYVHFDFGGKHWYELEEMECLNAGLLGTFFERTERGYVTSAFLYKTLGTDAAKTPGFQLESRHKTRLFSAEEASDLIYGVNYASRSTFRSREVKVIVLPRGEGLTAQQIERFFDHSGSINGEADAESELQDEVEKKHLQGNAGELDPLFAVLADDPDTRSIAQFDFIFSLAGGTSSDIDLIELAGLERSKLAGIRDRTDSIREVIEKERSEFMLQVYGAPPKKPFGHLRVTRCFQSILSNKTAKEKKYQSHLYKVLPKIYTGSYYQDLILLPAFIERTEADIRNDAGNYNLLKFDLYFLMKLQNYGGERLMDIQNSPSYQIGLLLGRLARGLRTKINSFDKNYAGLLSRRIGTLNDVLSLQNEFNQKLIMHDRASWSFMFSDELTGKLKEFTGAYNKDECAFGFFESYFAPRKHEEDEEETQVAPIEAEDN